MSLYFCRCPCTMYTVHVRRRIIPTDSDTALLLQLHANIPKRWRYIWLGFVLHASTPLLLHHWGKTILRPTERNERRILNTVVRLVQCASAFIVRLAKKAREKKMTNIPFKMWKYICRCSRSSGDVVLARALARRMLSPDDGKFLFKHLWKSFRKHFAWKSVRNMTQST